MRLANQNEAEACYQSIEDARAYHKSLGFEPRKDAEFVWRKV